jgi:hypothetical protein
MPASGLRPTPQRRIRGGSNQEIATSEMGFTVILRSNILEGRMSQMGHSRRSYGQQRFAECPLCLQ